MKLRTPLSILIGALAALTLSGTVLAQDDDTTPSDSSDSSASSYFVFKLGSEYNLEARDTSPCAGSQAAQEQSSYPGNASAGAEFVVTHSFVLPADDVTARGDVDTFVQDNEFTPQGEWRSVGTNGLSRAFTSVDAPGYNYIVDVYPQDEGADGQSSALCVTVLQDLENY